MSLSPIQPDLTRLRRRAKELFRAAKASDRDALAFLTAQAPGVPPAKLAVSQLAVARSEGFSSWPELKRAAENSAAEAVFQAVEDSDLETTARILNEYPSCAKRRNQWGANLLHTCVFGNDPDMAKLLLAAGVPRDDIWKSSAHSPLSWAATVGSLKVAEALIEAGAIMDLFTAAGLGNFERVKSFWSAGILSPKSSYTGSSRFDAEGNRLPRPPESEADQVSDALYIAARNGHLAVAKWLLDHGADPNFRGYEGGTALHWAEFSNEPEIVELINLAGGAEELLDHTFKATPRAFGMLCPAAYGMAYRLRQRLDRLPEDVNIEGEYGTAVNAAAWNNQLETLTLLLERGGDPKRRNQAGLNALEVAQARGHSDLIPILETYI